MTAAEKRARRDFYRRRYRINGKLILSLAVFFVCSMVFLSVMVNANSKAEGAMPSYKYYTSVQINQGDTLWDIASEYCPEQVAVKSYVNELKQMNNLAGDEIHAGRYIMVYYYSDEMK